jgi:hypothetical protein
MFSFRHRKLIHELSEVSIGGFSLKLEMLMLCSKTVGGALPHHEELEMHEKN